MLATPLGTQAPRSLAVLRAGRVRGGIHVLRAGPRAKRRSDAHLGDSPAEHEPHTGADAQPVADSSRRANGGRGRRIAALDVHEDRGASRRAKHRKRRSRVLQKRARRVSLREKLELARRLGATAHRLRHHTAQKLDATACVLQTVVALVNFAFQSLNPFIKPLKSALGLRDAISHFPHLLIDLLLNGPESQPHLILKVGNALLHSLTKVKDESLELRLCTLNRAHCLLEIVSRNPRKVRKSKPFVPKIHADPGNQNHNNLSCQRCALR
mmetsp:Transcript_26822/g.70487  ORF Transcript_26822/g.70487 Transcript_26822/m.70487 type:complete len:269 (+) Transcript_26822:418-1224(+)